MESPKISAQRTSELSPLPHRIVWTIVAAAAIIVFVALTAWLAIRYVDSEWQRDLRNWQVRMGIVTDSRFAAINGWVDEQLHALTALADNPSLQLYATQISMAPTDDESLSIIDTQTEYIRNLLEASALQSDFAGAAASPVKANLPSAGKAGIALLNANGEVVVASSGLPSLAGPLQEFVAALKPGSVQIRDLYKNATGQPSMAFAIPVFAVQGSLAPDAQIGTIIGVKEVGPELYPLLRQPGETSETAAATLVRSNGNVIEYLTPLRDGTAPLTLQMAADTPELDAVFATESSGGFAQRRDHRGRRVLVTARRFDAVPWTLMYTIERDEALADAEIRLRRFIAAALFAVCFLAALLVAAWRHLNLRQARQAAGRLQGLAAEIDHQRQLLRLVTDSQPTAVFILDEQGNYRFANRQAAAEAQSTADDMLGKSIAHVRGADVAKRYLTLNRQALDSAEVAEDLHRLDGPAGVQVIQSEHIPIAAAAGRSAGVLVVETDVTAAVAERERRARTLGDIVKTLVGVVDGRDPFAAHHSTRVAALSRAIAAEMNLPEQDVATAETAGSLLNFGKVLVAPELLTKTGELSDADRAKVRQSVQTSAALLQGIDFDGPVVETLRQAQAHWDGSGFPQDLAGEQILLTARIVGVANAFVGMVSRRAYREALDADKAMELLLAQVGKAFDRRVVAALVNYLDNRGGRNHWAVKPSGPTAAAAD
jgi:HD-GYP domain-containing protein (c-di-GMP phosphodiesterase class II)